jgi:hypothetical protein
MLILTNFEKLHKMKKIFILLFSLTTLSGYSQFSEITRKNVNATEELTVRDSTIIDIIMAHSNESTGGGGVQDSSFVTATADTVKTTVIKGTNLFLDLGSTSKSGAHYKGSTIPSGSIIENYGGYFRANRFYANGFYRFSDNKSIYEAPLTTTVNYNNFGYWKYGHIITSTDDSLSCFGTYMLSSYGKKQNGIYIAADPNQESQNNLTEFGNALYIRYGNQFGSYRFKPLKIYNWSTEDSMTIDKDLNLNFYTDGVRTYFKKGVSYYPPTNTGIYVQLYDSEGDSLTWGAAPSTDTLPIIKYGSSNINVTTAGLTVINRPTINVQGSGGAIDITSTPQIINGQNYQVIIIRGLSDVNTVKFDNGSGLVMPASVTLGINDILCLMYVAGTGWIQLYTSNN